MNVITQERLKEVLHYDPETGEFTWLVSRPHAPIGSVAGAESKRASTSYIIISVYCHKYTAHRLAWLYVYGSFPDSNIDHINGDGLDNRLSNLRESTHQQNSANMRIRKSNKLGVKGVCWDKAKRKYYACIRINYRSISLGRYDTIEEAALAYRNAAETAFGSFARLG